MKFDALVKKPFGRCADISADSIQAIVGWANEHSKENLWREIYVTTEDEKIGHHLFAVLEHDESGYLVFWEIFPGSGIYQRPNNHGTWELGWNCQARYNELVVYSLLIDPDKIDRVVISPKQGENKKSDRLTTAKQ